MRGISVVLNGRGKIASVWEDEITLRVFSPCLNGWKEREEYHFSWDHRKPISFLRSEIAALAEKLKDADVIVGKTINGLFYQIFDRKGFVIIEADRFTPELLDQIAKEVELYNKKAENEAFDWRNARPKEAQQPGFYFLDLSKLQKKAPQVTSKMALQPFFRDTPFLRLTLRCRHVPRWLPSYAEKRDWLIHSKQDDMGMELVTVEPTCCG
jgi:Fe-only nitrogenase accessory protein AnfO